MSIAFEQVSYTYLDASAQKQRRKAARAGGAVRAGGAGESATAKGAEAAGSVGGPEASGGVERAKWGTDPQAVWALHEVTFTLEDGDFLGIAGHTGSGKSTLIQHFNGLIRPTSGRVLFDGRDLAQKGSAAYARERCGLVLQYPEHQLFAATVYEDVAFGPRNFGVTGSELDERVGRALEQVGLRPEEVRDMSPFELSGGQQRRVALAGVLAMRPQVLVLDEPAAGLDPKARAEFLALLRGLHAQGMTVVMVSHNMDDLAALATRILVLSRGRILMQGTPEEVFADPIALRGVGLGVPAAQTFALRLREQGFALPRALYDVEALADDLAAALSAAPSAASAGSFAANRGAEPDYPGRSFRSSEGAR